MSPRPSPGSVSVAGPLVRPGRLGRLAPFAGAAAIAALTLALPGSRVELRASFFAAAGLLGLVLALASVVPWGRLPRWAQDVPALSFLVVVALLRDATGAGHSGYGSLLLLPVLWLALYGGYRALATAIAGSAAVILVPLAVVGPPAYPLSDLTRAILFPLVTGLVGLTVHRLVDDQRSRAAQLDDQRLFLQAVLDSVDVGVVGCDAHGRLSLFNRATRAMHGIDADENTPMASWADRFDLYAADGTTPLATDQVPLVRAWTEGAVRDAEIVIAPRACPPRRVLTHGTRLTRADGSPLGAVVAMHDVTARRQAEQQVRTARDLFAGVIDAATEQAIIGTDPQGTITVFNTGAQRMLGHGAEEVVGRAGLLALHDPDQVAARAGELGLEPGLEVVVAAARAGSPQTREWTYLTRDRRRLLVSLAVTAMRDERGALTGFIGVATDITAQRQAELAVRDSEERLRLLIDATTDYAIIMLDPTGRIRTWNTGAQRLIGYRAEEVLGRHFSMFYPTEQVAVRHPEHELEQAGTLGRYAEEGWRVRKDGGMFRASVVITAIRDETGRLRGFSKITRDLTAQHATERLKDQFVATVSHELRTPLTAIVGYLELLLEDAADLDARHARFLTTIDRNAGRLLRLVGDLLLTAQVDAGTLALHPGSVDLGALAAAAVQTAAPRAEGSGVSVHLSAEPLPPLLADAERLGQVLDNLLTNAIKFTPAGGRVHLRLAPAGTGVALEVSDTGIGIPLAEQGRLFERFFRSSAATDRAIPGIGLGLSIVKAIVDAHHGTLTVTSTEGAGTTFRVELPSAPATHAVRRDRLAGRAG